MFLNLPPDWETKTSIQHQPPSNSLCFLTKQEYNKFSPSPNIVLPIHFLYISAVFGLKDWMSKKEMKMKSVKNQQLNLIIFIFYFCFSRLTFKILCLNMLFIFFLANTCQFDITSSRMIARLFE